MSDADTIFFTLLFALSYTYTLVVGLLLTRRIDHHANWLRFCGKCDTENLGLLRDLYKELSDRIDSIEEAMRLRETNDTTTL